MSNRPPRDFSKLVLIVLITVVASAALLGSSLPVGAQSQTTTANGTDINQSDPSVTFSNQTTNGTTITVESATLPEDGFLVLHGSPYALSSQPYVIGLTDRMQAGTYENITINVSTRAPGSENISRINSSEQYVVKFYPDTDDNGKFTWFGLPPTDADKPQYPGNGSDTAYIVSRSDPRYNETNQWPSVSVSNQSSKGKSITVDSATLPQGGYVVVHDSSFLPPENATYKSVIGVSERLPPGTHRDVTVDLFDVRGTLKVQSELRGDQRIAVSVARDRGEKRKYEYVSSKGGTDLIYVDENSSFARDVASVTVTGQQNGTIEDGNQPVNDTSRFQRTSTGSSASNTTMAPPQNSGSQGGSKRLVDIFIANIVPISIGMAILCIVVAGMVLSRQFNQQNQNRRQS